MPRTELSGRQNKRCGEKCVNERNTINETDKTKAQYNFSSLTSNETALTSNMSNEQSNIQPPTTDDPIFVDYLQMLWCNDHTTPGYKFVHYKKKEHRPSSMTSLKG